MRVGQDFFVAGQNDEIMELSGGDDQAIGGVFVKDSGQFITETGDLVVNGQDADAIRAGSNGEPLLKGQSEIKSAGAFA